MKGSRWRWGSLFPFYTVHRAKNSREKATNVVISDLFQCDAQHVYLTQEGAWVYTSWKQVYSPYPLASSNIFSSCCSLQAKLEADIYRGVSPVRDSDLGHENPLMGGPCHICIYWGDIWILGFSSPSIRHAYRPGWRRCPLGLFVQTLVWDRESCLCKVGIYHGIRN